jgi:hypothetical protein
MVAVGSVSHTHLHHVAQLATHSLSYRAATAADADADDRAAVLGDDLTFTRGEAARLPKISLRTLHRLRPQLAPVCVGRGSYRYRRSDLLAYLAALPAGCHAQAGRRGRAGSAGRDGGDVRELIVGGMPAGVGSGGLD